MLVPGMQLEEIRKEIDLDFSSVLNKIHSEKNLGFRYMLKGKLKYIHRSFDYVSPRKNNWIMGYTFSAPTRKKESHYHIALMYQKEGFTAFYPSVFPRVILLYTSHFFKRYNERLQLNLVDPKDKIRYFMEHNSETPYEKLEDIRPGVYSFFAVNRMGIMLGVKYEKENIAKFNTFITKEMLKGDQVALSEKLKQRINKYSQQKIID